MSRFVPQRVDSDVCARYVERMLYTRTLRLRIKDKHSDWLNALSREVNWVFNFCNETSMRASRPFYGKAKWLSGYDLQKLVAGATKEGLYIPCQTLQQVCEEYATRRKQFKKHKLNWRVSDPKSPRRSLGWLPFKKGAVVYRNGQVRYAGRYLNLWDSYGLSKFELRGGNFSQDARGRWYLNVVVVVPACSTQGTGAVGIDLGIKEAAVCSDGQRIQGHCYRNTEEALGRAQRARKKQRVRAIHAKVANQRKDLLHQFSTRLVRQYALVAVGNVSSQALVKTTMAKGTLDAGWTMFKTMLEYKCHRAGSVFVEVNEAYTSQRCACCGCISSGSPKGVQNLRVRQWVCTVCGSAHERDVNAACNIRALGLATLYETEVVEGEPDEPTLNEQEYSCESGHGLPAEGIVVL